MIQANISGGGQFTVEGNQINGVEKKIDIVRISENNFHLLIDNRSFNAQLVSHNKEEKKIVLLINGNEYEIDVKSNTDLFS